MDPEKPPRLPPASLVPAPSGPEAFRAPVTISSSPLTELPVILDRSASNNSLISVTTLPSVKDGDVTPTALEAQTGTSPGSSSLSRLTSTQSKVSSGGPLNSPDMPTPSSLISQSTNASGSSASTVPLNLPQPVLKAGQPVLAAPPNLTPSLNSPSSAFSSPADSTTDAAAIIARSPFPADAVNPTVSATLATAVPSEDPAIPPSSSDNSLTSDQQSTEGKPASAANRARSRSRSPQPSPLAVLRSPSLPAAIEPSSKDVPVAAPVLPPVAPLGHGDAPPPTATASGTSDAPSIPKSPAASKPSASKLSPTQKRSRPSDSESINTNLAVSSATEVSEASRKPAKKPRKKKSVSKADAATSNGSETADKAKPKSNGQKKDAGAANTRKRQRPKPAPAESASAADTKAPALSPTKAKRVRSEQSIESAKQPSEIPLTPSERGSENGSNGADSDQSEDQKSDAATDKRKVKRFSNTCPKCSSKFTYPAGREFIRCPNCHEVTHVVDQPGVNDEGAKQAEDAFYESLSEFKAMFDRSNSALVWLARASPTRSWKFAVPNACRWPKASSGQGGYATAFRKLGLSLRSSDTKSGHWHYWYFEPKKYDFKALQRALQRRWKESPHYSQHLTEAALRRAKEKQKESDKSLNLADANNLSEALKAAAASLLSSSLNPPQNPGAFNQVPSQMGLPFLPNPQPHPDMWSNFRGGFPPGMTPELAAALLQSQQPSQPPFQSTVFPNAFSTASSPPFGSLNPSLLSSLGVNQLGLSSLLQSNPPAQPQAQHPSQSLGGWQPKQSMSADPLGLSSALPSADVTMEAARQRVSPPSTAASDATANKVYQQMLQQLQGRQNSGLGTSGLTGFDLANAQEKLTSPFQSLNSVATGLNALPPSQLANLVDTNIPTPPLQASSKLPNPTASAGVSSSSLPPNAAAASKALSIFSSMPPEVQQLFLSGASIESLLAQANSQIPAQSAVPSFRTNEPPHAFSGLNQPQSSPPQSIPPYFQGQLGGQGGMGVNPGMYPMLYNQMHSPYLSQMYSTPSYPMGPMDPMSFRGMSGFQPSQQRTSLDTFQQQPSLPISNLFASSSADKAAASSNVSVSSTTTAN